METSSEKLEMYLQLLAQPFKLLDAQFGRFVSESDLCENVDGLKQYDH